MGSLMQSKRLTECRETRKSRRFRLIRNPATAGAKPLEPC